MPFALLTISQAHIGWNPVVSLKFFHPFLRLYQNLKSTHPQEKFREAKESQEKEAKEEKHRERKVKKI